MSLLTECAASGLCLSRIEYGQRVDPVIYTLLDHWNDPDEEVIERIVCAAMAAIDTAREGDLRFGERAWDRAWKVREWLLAVYAPLWLAELDVSDTKLQKRTAFRLRRLEEAKVTGYASTEVAYGLLRGFAHWTRDAPSGSILDASHGRAMAVADGALNSCSAPFDAAFVLYSFGDDVSWSPVSDLIHRTVEVCARSVAVRSLDAEGQPEELAREALRPILKRVSQRLADLITTLI